MQNGGGFGFGFGSSSSSNKKSKGKNGQNSFPYSGKLRPGKQSEKRLVPDEIMRPDYAGDGIPKHKDPKFPWIIHQNNEEDIKNMRIAGKLAREVLDAVSLQLKVGMTTDEIDEIVHKETISRGAYPSPLNYSNFPKSCCTSINEVICHGIPDSTILEDGDLINVDVTIYKDGYHGDCSETFAIGNVDEEGKKLVQITYEAWQKAIAFCKPGKSYNELGGIIEDYITKNGYTSVREFCGHGIGKDAFHTTPNILHYRNNIPAGTMKEGHIFTIEPMICEGTNKHLLWPDKWTSTTADGRRSAQFEHTLLITKDGVEPLTAKLETSPKYFWEK